MVPRKGNCALELRGGQFRKCGQQRGMPAVKMSESEGRMFIVLIDCEQMRTDKRFDTLKDAQDAAEDIAATFPGRRVLIFQLVAAGSASAMRWDKTLDTKVPF